jgi:hypothetical protein
MGDTEEARAILRQAEAAIRELIERRLAAEAYEEVAKLARLAAGLATLLREEEGHAAEAQTAKPPSPRRGKRKRPRGRRGGGKKAGYPRFVREGDRLVKVGWSKKNKSEYEHRAPRSAVVAFATHLCSNVEVGGTFTVEDLLPVPDPAHDGELPAYQVYMVLAWLRTTGAVEKRGRQGYVLRRNVLPDKEIARLSASLPARTV